MRLTGVTEFADRGVEALSGGQLQRVWLACCLAQDTDVLLLDEPTTYLDLRYQVEILDLARELADLHGVTVGMVLHDLDQAAAVSDRVVLLSEGRVVAAGDAAEVYDADLLTRVYGIRIEVEHDPLTGAPRTRAVGAHHLRSTSLPTERTP
jgi:iron complex transport system ATP-binding protein